MRSFFTTFKWRSLAIMAFSTLSTLALADTFTISAIQIHGLQRIPRDTVLDYLHIAPGDDFDTEEASVLVDRLYASHFFKNVAISRQGNVLIVNVVEQPVIVNIQVNGNESIDKDKMQEVMKTVGLIEGVEFSAATLERFKQSLTAQYYQLGHYNARVETQVVDDSHNRVDLKIRISEGRAVQVKGIDILGNHAFDEGTLIDQLDLTTSVWTGFFTKANQYNREKLDTSVKKLIDYYLDHGYLRMKVDSVQAQLSPDRNSIYIHFKISEGAVYHISQVQVLGKVLLTAKQLQSLIEIAKGQVFDKAKVTQTQQNISDALGDQGYAFANISMVPTIDDAKKTVSMAIFIDPGQKVYVRHIHFTGNNQTNDLVLRRSLRQLEGSLSSTQANKDSEERMRMLGPYIREVTSEIQPVAGKPDQVDILYKVQEEPPATAIGGISYGTDGFGFNASLNNSNILGSGKTVGLGINQTPYMRTYSINYLNPYYTLNRFLQYETSGFVPLPVLLKS